MRPCSFAPVAVAALALLLAAPPAGAHLNSPDQFLDEEVAGEPLVIAVRMPSAVPGEAEVEVRFHELAPDEEASVRTREIPPLGGEKAASPWRTAVRSKDDRSFFSSPVPLTIYGTWRVQVEVTTAKGTGSVDIPIPADVPKPKRMPLLLAVVFGVLLVLAVTQLALVMRGMGREVHLHNGAPVTPRDERRGWTWGIAGMTLQAAFFVVVFLWWDEMASAYSRLSVDQLEASVTTDRPPVAGERTVTWLTITDSKGNPLQGVLPDHGKVMHLAIVRVPGASTFLHVHPVQTAPGVFRVELEPPEPGRLAFFGDIVDPAGVGQTVTASLEVAPGPGGSGAVPGDPDNSMRVHAPIDHARLGAVESDLGDGLLMRWEREPGGLAVGELERHAFVVTTPAGEPATLEPYMGMAGHLMAVREDAQVFAHVHPTGTVAGRMPTAGGPHCHVPPGGVVSFPYAFPHPGTYRVWIQVKVGGVVRTGVFDVEAA